jgi:hypothetical protein
METNGGKPFSLIWPDRYLFHRGITVALQSGELSIYAKPKYSLPAVMAFINCDRKAS